jgi:DNA-binding NarL/FixJ family response regulator
MSTVIYFRPTVDPSSIDELSSISEVVDVLRREAEIDIRISGTWSSVMTELLEAPEQSLLIVFRLDFLEREHMMLDEVLSMLSSLVKFVANKKTVDIAVVSDRALDKNTLVKLKRNCVLGIIPAMRFFDKKHTITAYQTLVAGDAHWPAVCIKDTNTVKKNSIALTDRQSQIFNMVAKRGMSNKQIAGALKISEQAVKNHVSIILRKFGLKTRTQLALANKTDVTR